MASEPDPFEALLREVAETPHLTPDLVAGTDLTDDIRILRAVGRGGMGVVYEAQQDSQRVAVKVLRRDIARGAAERFDREVRILSLLEHPGIVGYRGHGTAAGGASFLVMEWLEGEDLAARLTRGVLSVDETTSVVDQLCSALSAAHHHGLVHRDIKPSNIFFSAAEDGGEVVKVLDFGVAKVPDALADGGLDPTRTGALLGTPCYMSPEQAQGRKDIDARADVWAVGVVAFECLTGERPFEANALGPLIAKIMTAPVDHPALAPGIERCIGRALERDRDKRFATAAQLASAFAGQSHT